MEGCCADNHDKAKPQEQDPFHVDYFRPEDAEGIVRFFQAVYGDHDPIRRDWERATAQGWDGRKTI